MSAATNANKKFRQYYLEYLKYSFVPLFANETIPMCLLCEKSFSNDATKLDTMRDHLERIYSNKENKDVEYYEMLQ